jgi:sarcosine oxidase subunit beta
VTRSADVLVIGAGISGVATAYFLAERGLSVRLADTHHPAWGATGRNSGVLWMQSKPAASLAFFFAARRFTEALQDRFPKFRFRAGGGLLACRDEALLPRLRALVDGRNADGMPCEFLDGSDARALCPSLSPLITGALYCAADAHQDTRGLVACMVDALERSGNTVLRNAQVVTPTIVKSKWTGAVFADRTTVSAAMTVVAAGPWSNALLAPQGLAIPLRTVRYEAAETEPAPFRIDPVFCGEALLHMMGEGKDLSFPDSAIHPAQRLDSNLLFAEQLAQYEDGTIRFGSAYRIDTMDDRATVAGQAMGNAVLTEDFPKLAKLRITGCWGGIVAETSDALPVLDNHGPEGLLINAGNSNGNLSGAFCGSLAADLLTGQVPPVATDPLRRSRFAAPTSMRNA